MRKGTGKTGDKDGDGDLDEAGDRNGHGAKKMQLPLESVSPQPVVTQVIPPGNSSVALGRQTGDTRFDSCAGVASLIRVMSSRMVSMLNLGFLKTWSRQHCSQHLHPLPGCRARGTPQGPVGTPGTNGDPGDCSCGSRAGRVSELQSPVPGTQGSRDTPGHIPCRDEVDPGGWTPIPWEFPGTWGHPVDLT